MFRFKKSIPVEYDQQGYIYFVSRMYKSLGRREQQHISALCERVGGEYGEALFEFVTTDAGAVAVCRKHYLSQSTLDRIVKKYYVAFAQRI